VTGVQTCALPIFDTKFLVTPPEKLAQRIIRGIRNKELRIIFGNESTLAWFGSTFLPRKIQNSVIWNKFKGAFDYGDYRLFSK